MPLNSRTLRAPSPFPIGVIMEDFCPSILGVVVLLYGGTFRSKFCKVSCTNANRWTNWRMRAPKLWDVFCHLIGGFVLKNAARYCAPPLTHTYAHWPQPLSP